MKSVGFKEWALVCDAIGRGEQSVIVRKGGIAEGRAGFSFRHSAFFLLPTFFHEQITMTRLPSPNLPVVREGVIGIQYFVEVERSKLVTSWEEVETLEPLHVLTREVVRERFEYAHPRGVHVAWVKAFRLTPEWILPDSKRFAGCRSWIDLPELPAETVTTPVTPALVA